MLDAVVRLALDHAESGRFVPVAGGMKHVVGPGRDRFVPGQSRQAQALVYQP